MKITKEYYYSEIFHSIQGEGKYTGVPTLWLRYFLCNLQCNGFGQKDPTDPSTYILPYKDIDPSQYNRMEDLPVFEYGCDSSYSWSKKFKNLQHRGTPEQIADRIIEFATNEYNPKGTFLHPSGQEQHMCFTGGEPLMSHAQECTIGIMKHFKNMQGGKMPETDYYKGSNHPASVTFETNGTQPLTEEFVEYFTNPGCYDGEVFFSVSPKLFTVSGENPDKAINPANVATYTKMQNSNGQLKFVMGPHDDQWEELARVVDQFRDAGVRWPVYIMPVGATVEGQKLVDGDVAERAFKAGYNVSARVHTYLWGNVIGV